MLRACFKLFAFVCALAAPAAAQALAEWSRDVPQAPMPGVDMPDAPRQQLTDFVRKAAGMQYATLTWAYVSQRSEGRRGGATYLIYAGRGSSGPPDSRGAAHRGVMGMLRIEGENITEVTNLRIPPPDQMKWQVLRPTDIDGDGVPDTLLTWNHAAKNFTRRGMIVGRSRPAALTMLELDSTTTTDEGERKVVAKVACFFPVKGLGAKALIVQRRERLTMRGPGGHDRDAMELFFPAPDGRFAPGQVYGAMFGADGAYDQTVKAWAGAFGVRGGEQAIAQQAVPGDCPAAGLVLPQRAVGQPAGPEAMTVVGPFATTSDAVWTTLNALGKKAPRAAVVIGIGSI